MRYFLLFRPVHRWVWGAFGALVLAFRFATPSRTT